jgi:hypothetical protein
MKKITKKEFICHKNLFLDIDKNLKKTCYEKETTPFGCTVFVGRYNGSDVL